MTDEIDELILEELRANCAAIDTSRAELQDVQPQTQGDFATFQDLVKLTTDIGATYHESVNEAWVEEGLGRRRSPHRIESVRVDLSPQSLCNILNRQKPLNPYSEVVLGEWRKDVGGKLIVIPSTEQTEKGLDGADLH